MTPDEIAATILGTLMPEARRSWRYEVGPAAALLQLTFWPVSLVDFLDIGAVLGCFQDFQRQVSWQGGIADEPDLPRIVFRVECGALWSRPHSCCRTQRSDRAAAKGSPNQPLQPTGAIIARCEVVAHYGPGG